MRRRVDARGLLGGQRYEQRQGAEARANLGVSLVLDAAEQLGRRQRLVVEGSAVSFLPEAPQHQEHKRVEAFVKGLSEGGSGQ